MSDFPVSEFMTREVITVAPDASLREVARHMHSARISCVVVCEERRPVGVISERDMVRICGELLSGDSLHCAKDVMSKGIITMAQSASCTKTLSLLRERSIRRMVIVDETGNLAGVITQTDLLRAHTRGVEMQKQELELRVQERTRELKQANERLESLSRIDPMLNIGNRRAMDDELEKLQNRLIRYGQTFSLALVDVDRFKLYNDHYGHQAGDKALAQIAMIMRDSIRKPDDVFRYGGEEFLVVLPELDLFEAQQAAERIRAGVEAAAIEHVHADSGVVTVSIGVECEDTGAPDWSRLISRADDALYDAKNNGRNCVRSLSCLREAV